MTKQNEALTAIHDNVRARMVKRAERDAKLKESASSRVKGYVAFFATDSFAKNVTEFSINLDSLLDQCDKTLDRFRRVSQSLNRDSLALVDDRDQNRYTFNLARSLVAAHAKSMTEIQRDDMRATGSKRDVDETRDYITVAKRHMQDSTTERQVGIGARVLRELGFCEPVFNGNKLVSLRVKPKSAAFRKFTKLIASGQ